MAKINRPDLPCAKCKVAEREVGHYCRPCNAEKRKQHQESCRANPPTKTVKVATMAGVCKFDGCNRSVQARGLCRSCFAWCKYYDVLDQYADELKYEPWQSEMIERRCSTCRVVKPVELFSKRANKIKSICSECESVARRARTLATYGWTVEDFDLAFKSQGGMCANPACDRPATEVDHCHDSNMAREILCDRCNPALGMLRDDPELIRGLAEYAERWLWLKEDHG